MIQEKDTGSLQQELMQTANLQEFLSENTENFSSGSLPDMLGRLVDEYGMSKAEIARRASMSEIYLHQIFAGRRNPSRSRIICLCFGLGATIAQAQELLKLGGLAQLYPKNRRDAIILFGLSHGMTLSEVNDRLFQEDEETLY